MKRIGVMGGSFNPIHNGHIEIAREAAKQLRLDKVLFIPVGNHPFAKTNMADDKDRYNMVKLSVDREELFEACDIEISRKGFSYTVDTLRELKDIYSDSELFFIVGADILEELGMWKDVSEIFKLCKFVVVYRPIYAFAAFYSMIEKVEKEYDVKIEVVEVPGNYISSTAIREMANRREVIAEYVADEVEKYILNKKLFIEKESDDIC